MSTIITSSEYTRAHCRRTGFSGVRSDPILKNMEIWVLGSIAKEVSQLALELNPRAVEEAYAEVFQLDPEQVKVIG